MSTQPVEEPESIPTIEPEPEVVALLERLKVAKSNREMIDNEIEQLSNEIERLVPRNAVWATPDGHQWRASVVRKENVRLDIVALRKYAPELYEKATKTVADLPAFARLLKSGQVDARTAAKVATITPQRPYVVFKDLTVDSETTDE